MSLANVRQFHRTGFAIPRFTDKEIITRLEALVQEGGYKIEKRTFSFTFADQNAEFSGDARDSNLDQLLDAGAISIRYMQFRLSGTLQVNLERPWEGSQRKLLGNHDTLYVGPGEQNHLTIFLNS